MGEAKRRSQLDPNYVQGKPQEVAKLQQAPRQLQEKKRLDIISVENRSAMILQILSFALKHKPLVLSGLKFHTLLTSLFIRKKL
jgi:hypothetical protein